MASNEEAAHDEESEDEPDEEATATATALSEKKESPEEVPDGTAEVFCADDAEVRDDQAIDVDGSSNIHPDIQQLSEDLFGDDTETTSIEPGVVLRSYPMPRTCWHHA